MEITPEDVKECNEYCSIRNLPKNRTILDVCEKDLNLFLTHMMGMKPRAWQYIANKRIMERIAKGEYVKLVLCNSRQIGKSREIVGIALWRVIFNLGWKCRKSDANSNQHTAIGIVSRSADQAKKLIKNIRDTLKQGDAYMSKYKDKSGKSIYGDDFFSSKVADIDEGPNNMNIITFKAGIGGSIVGSFIQCLPPTDAILGNTFTDLYLDEAARIPDVVMDENAPPTLAAMGNFQIVASTPELPTGYFFRRVDPYNQYDNEGYDVFVYTIDAIKYDAPEQYAASMKDIKEKIADGKVNEVNRNYYCSFTSTDETYFPIDKVREIFTDDIQPVKEYKKETVTLGIDFGGKMKSHSVMTIVTNPDINNIQKRIMVWRYPVKKDGDMIKDIDEYILPNFNVAQIVIDYCPASYMASQQMKDKGWNVREFQFSKTTKPDFMERFRRKIARRQVLSFKDETLLEEFIRYGDDMKPQGDATDDMIDSFMLACVPFLEQRVKFGAMLINPPKDDEELAQWLMKQNELDAKEDKGYLGYSRAI